jgi:hypothetical protein
MTWDVLRVSDDGLMVAVQSFGSEPVYDDVVYSPELDARFRIVGFGANGFAEYAQGVRVLILAREDHVSDRLQTGQHLRPSRVGPPIDRGLPPEMLNLLVVLNRAFPKHIALTETKPIAAVLRRYVGLPYVCLALGEWLTLDPGTVLRELQSPPTPPEAHVEVAQETLHRAGLLEWSVEFKPRML